MKLIIPLLDKNLTKEDISPEAGFIDAYNYDINRPALEDCVFLMYDASTRTPQSNKRYGKFEKLNTIRSSKIIRVNKKTYLVYAFVVLDTDIKNLLKGLRHTKSSSYVSFVQFWQATDGVVNRYIVNPAEPLDYQARSVPEEDYNPSLSEIRDKNERRVPV